MDPRTSRNNGAEIEQGFILIVGTTAERDVRDRRLTAFGEWHDVVELEEGGRRAATFAVSDKTAPATVALPNRTLHFRGGRARPRSHTTTQP